MEYCNIIILLLLFSLPLQYLYYVMAILCTFASMYYNWASSYFSVFFSISVCANKFILAFLSLSALYHYGVTKCLKCIVPHLFASHFYVHSVNCDDSTFSFHNWISLNEKGALRQSDCLSCVHICGRITL